MKASSFFIIAMLNFILCSAYAQDSIEDKLSMADSLYQKGRIDSALLINDEIIRMTESIGDTLHLVDAYSSRGVFMRSSGNLEDAADAYNKALEYVMTLDEESEESLQSIATLYNNLSTLYLDMKNPEQAINYALKAASMADKSSDKLFRSQIYSVASSIFITQKEYEPAKTYLKKAMKLADETQQPESELYSISYYLLVLLKTGASESEFSKYIERASTISKEVESFMSIVNYYQILFYIQNEKKNYNEAIYTAEKILALDGISSYPFLKYDVYNNLHQIYKIRNDYKNAYDILDKAKVLGDSLFEDSKGKQIEELSAKYETAKKEIEIKELNKQKQEDRMRILILIISLSSVIVLAIFITGYLLKSRKLQAEQARRENEERIRQFEQIQRKTEHKLTKEYIEKLEKERMRLAGELHDGICNDLYALEVNIRSNKQVINDKWLSSLTEARENIRRVSHELLPPEFKEASIDQVINNYIKSLDSKDCHITLKTLPEDCDWRVLPENMSLNIYRIIQEAVANSLKYSGAKNIEIKIEWILPDLVISVCDDGTGIKGTRTGAGKRTLEERAKAINAVSNIESNDKGTCIYVRIPIFK